mgnify:FL=1
MPSVDIIYIITTRQFVRPSRGIDKVEKSTWKSVIFASLTPWKKETGAWNYINNYYIIIDNA